tara:strand:+ start:7049 stop:7459 length:411 start_codon:yes stop_codon:yes gene_type:complete
MDRVRLARDGQDVSHVVRLTMALAEAIGGPQRVDPAHTGAQVLRLMHSPSGVVYVSAGGFIAGEVSSTIINPDPVAIEHGWFATDRSGLRLLDAFEAWAKDIGCVGVKMSTAAIPGGVGTILERRRYKPAELAWFR